MGEPFSILAGQLAEGFRATGRKGKQMAGSIWG
jgi:hypothetical protein